MVILKFLGPVAVGQRCEAKMAGQKPQHAERDVFGLDSSQCLLDEVSVAGLPVWIENAGVDAESDSVAVLLAASGCVDTLAKARCARLVGLDHVLAVQAPGDNCMFVRLDGEQIVNIAALGQQHEKASRETGEKRNQHCREICYVVKRETVEHFAHIEADLALCAG